jgi:hypothetical protein
MLVSIRTLRSTLTLAALLLAQQLLSGSAFSQECNSSLNVDPAKTVVLEAWDGSGESTVMSCGDAENFRGQIFRQQLAYLSDPQSISADRVNSDITDAVKQLKQLKQDLVNAQNNEQASAVSATIKSMLWLATKAKLLICGIEAPETGGLALVACAKTLISFLKQSKDTFKEFSSVAEARDRATRVQQLIDQMQTEIAQIASTNIDGTVTAQGYSTVFQSLCTQIKNSCLASSPANRATRKSNQRNMASEPHS